MNNKLTRKDIEEMQAEIDRRKLVERPKLLEEVKETRAQGDLSENFEYHVAKRAKNQNESRIRFLERMIKTAKIIEDDAAENEAGINKKVTLYIPDEDEEEVYTIVSTMRQDSLKGLVFGIENRNDGRGDLGREFFQFDPPSLFVLLEDLQNPIENDGSIILPNIVQIETVPADYAGIIPLTLKIAFI